MRNPIPAGVSNAIPSLGDLRRAATLTGSTFGVLVLGAAISPRHEPQCAQSRAEELRTHGAVAAQKLSRDGPSAALAEIAIAVGMARHPAPPPEIERVIRPGEITAVGPVPPTPPVIPQQLPPPDVRPPIPTAGSRPTVTRLPPSQPIERPRPRVEPPEPPQQRVRPSGGPMAVSPVEQNPQ